jgi:hypothetical protein
MRHTFDAPGLYAFVIARLGDAGAPRIAPDAPGIRAP